jgi:hypothetical protein
MENKLDLGWCQGYNGLKYHMEDALLECNLNPNHAIWNPPMALFSKKYYNELNELNHEKIYDFCFIGSINSNFTARQWVINFAKKYFTGKSIFINTDNDPKWELLGTFDYSNMNLGFNPKQQKYNQSKNVQYRIVKENVKYFETMCQSKFVLCPAGDSTWSFRFYEVLMCKSIPIVENWHHTYRTREEANIKYKYLLDTEVKHDEILYHDYVNENTKIFEKYHMLNNMFMTKIPKVIFQTSITRQPEYVIDLIKSRSPGWEYIHFTDDDIFKFFEENIVDEFPNMKDKFLSIKRGAHRADLFRYYYLYIKGGVFIDSDAMIEQDINMIAKDYDFFSVESTFYINTIFNGFIGATKKNIIMYEALKHAYNIDVDELDKTYFILCKKIKDIYDEYKAGQNTLLYMELVNDDKSAKMVNVNNETILIHYYKDKLVPVYNKNKIIRPINTKTKIGITLDLPKEIVDLFTNGIRQNAIFFYRLLKNIGKYDIYFIFKNINGNILVDKMKFDYVLEENILNANFDIIFTFGYMFSTELYLVTKDLGTRHIFYNCGNIFIRDSETTLFKDTKLTVSEYQRYNIYDECWNIPQMTNTNQYYLKTLLRCNTIEVPFIWSPEFIDSEKHKYIKRSESKSIAIFEPNLGIMKWSFPAVLICENAYRDPKITDKIKHIYVTNMESKNSNNSFKTNFNNLVTSLDLKKDNKLSIESRYNSLYFMSKYTDIVVSHTWENWLNYLYLDLAWMGWPIVHNGKLCKEVGYYYDEFNYEMGGNALKDAISNHDENADEYLLRNRLYIQKYLPTNKALKKHYEDLITNFLSTSKTTITTNEK